MSAVSNELYCAQVSECREEKDSDGFYVNPYCSINCVC